MPTTLELCEKYFSTRDIYNILNLTKDANERDVKKAYHRMSRQIHPDRVPENEKEEATEKFKVLTKINSVLSNSMKRAMYDEQGSIDDGSETDCDWQKIWREIFDQIESTENENFFQSYKGSNTEKRDICKAYLDGKGCINFMLKSVPFMTVEEEPRIIEIVNDWIAKFEVPEYKQFTEEPKAKRNRRHKLYLKTEHQLPAKNFIEQLTEKHSNANIKSKKKMVSVKKKTATTSKQSDSKQTLNKVKSGRVSKKK